MSAASAIILRNQTFGETILDCFSFFHTTIVIVTLVQFLHASCLCLYFLIGDLNSSNTILTEYTNVARAAITFKHLCIRNGVANES